MSNDNEACVNWLGTLHKVQDQLFRDADMTSRLSESFYNTGNEVMGKKLEFLSERLVSYAEQISNALVSYAEQISNATGSKLEFDLKEAQKSSAMLLQTILATDIYDRK